MDRTFTLMSEDPEIGPKLRAVDTPQRFEFTDLDLVVNIRAGGPDEQNLAWEWSDDARYSEKWASLAYRIAVNYFIYDLTH